MKIFMYCIFPLDGTSPKGGVETATYNLLSGFKTTEDEILAISFNKDIFEKKIIQFSSNIIIKLFPYRYRISTILEILLHSKIVLSKECKLFKPDIIHIQGNGSRLFTISKLKKIAPVIATPHAILENEIVTLTSLLERFNYRLMMLAEQKNIRYLSGLIFIAEYYYKYFSSKYQTIKYKNNIVLFNAAGTEFFKQDPNINYNNEIIYVGVISKRKNILFLLEALNKLAQQGIFFKLHIIGGYSDPDYKNKVETYINENGIERNLKFYGWLKQEEVLELLKKCDIFVLPSKAEGLPISIAEALSLGRIIISSAVGGIPEMITNNETGYLFSTNNIIELIDILKKINNNRQDKKRISQKAKEFAYKSFKPDVVAFQTRVFYISVIKNANHKT